MWVYLLKDGKVGEGASMLDIWFQKDCGGNAVGEQGHSWSLLNGYPASRDYRQAVGCVVVELSKRSELATEIREVSPLI